MRVLYLSRGGNPHDRRFLMALAQTSHEVAFLPIEVSADSERKFIPTGVELVEPDQSLSPAVLMEILARLQPDLIHAGPIQTGAHLAAQTGWHPLVSMSWGSDLLVEAQEGEGKRRAETALQASDVLVCDCQAVRNAAIELGMQDDKIVIFPWGVDLKLFAAGRNTELRKRLSWDDNFVLLSTRSWEPLYGVDLILKAFIEASAKDASLRLLMLGDGSQRDELLDEVEQAGLSDHVHAPGIVDQEELPAYYRAADLYISASHSDGTSVSLLESMASGLPAIVSDIPGNQEWVAPETNGWWFQDGDSEDLAAKILDAVNAITRFPDMKRSARGIAESRGDWKVNFGGLLEAYEMAFALVNNPQ